MTHDEKHFALSSSVHQKEKKKENDEFFLVSVRSHAWRRAHGLPASLLINLIKVSEHRRTRWRLVWGKWSAFRWDEPMRVVLTVRSLSSLNIENIQISQLTSLFSFERKSLRQNTFLLIPVIDWRWQLAVNDDIDGGCTPCSSRCCFFFNSIRRSMFSASFCLL